MYTPHILDSLALAHERGSGLRAEVGAERLAGTPRRNTLAASLRRAADRLDPTSLAARPASQS